MSKRALRWHAPTILWVLAAQLCTALADNALLIIAIALLDAGHSPGWITPALRIGFYASYVLLAPFAGHWADAWPKAKLMAIVNGIKLAGVAALASGIHPLLIFAVIGFGAATYAPARYGMLPELTAGRNLVQANAAMEIVTIVAIIGGALLGSVMVSAAGNLRACAVLGTLYALAAACTLTLKPTGALVGSTVSFRSGTRLLLTDAVACNALVLTSIFWAAAAVLQFIMIEWARRALGLSLAHAGFLSALFAIGMVSGAVLAGARPRPPGRRVSTACGMALAIAIVSMPLVHSLGVAGALLATTGLLAGALLVPMNATLQQRGAVLVLPGLSVAVQNFFENALSIVFLCAYGAALACGVSLDATIYGLGSGVVLLVCLNAWRNRSAASVLSTRPA